MEKQRDLLEHALKILEREYGPEHHKIAINLTDPSHEGFFDFFIRFYF